MDDKLVTQQQAELEQAEKVVGMALPPAFKAIYQLDRELAMRALAIKAARPTDEDPPLTLDKALAAALHEQKTGQIVGREFYIDPRLGLVPGYRGIAREAGENGAGLWQDNYRAFTEAEKAEHDIEPGDDAVVCELTQYKAAEAAKRAGIEYKPRLGYGIVKAFEHKNSKGYEIKLKGGYTWTRKARNRALKDALRHAGLADDAKGILEDLEAEGLPITLDREVWDKLTPEQVAYVKRQAELKAADDARPQAEKDAEDERSAAYWKKMAYEGRMGMADRCPDCGADLPDHADDCKWFEFSPNYGAIEDIPSAREERGELTPAEAIREKLRAEAASIQGDATPLEQRNAVASLAKVYPSEDDRHAVTAWLFGKESTKDLSRGELVACRNWVDVTRARNPDVADPKDKNAWDWVPSDRGVREARIVAEYLGLGEEAEIDAEPAQEVAE